MNSLAESKRGSSTVKQGMAKMLKGGVIMDVIDVEQVRQFPILYIISMYPKYSF